MSARTGEGSEPGSTKMLAGEWIFTAPEVDYEIYAEGEALLGWLNATVVRQGRKPFDGNALLRELPAKCKRGSATRAARSRT